MRLVIDAQEQEHIYVCLKEAEKSFTKQRKGAEALNLSTDAIDQALELNKSLRRKFNPHAEDEAREAARRKSDPTQMDIEDSRRTTSGETGGGHVAGEITGREVRSVDEIPPTDLVIRDNLMACGLMVLMTDIRLWASSDRDRVITFTREFDRLDPNSRVVAPSCLEFVAISEERMDALNRIGPYKVRGFPEDVDVPTSTLVYLPGGPGESELIEGEYVDSQEAEIRCALLNRTLLRAPEIADDAVDAWRAAGPWSVIGVGDDADARVYVVNELIGQRERVEDRERATRIAAVYNRFEAGQNDDVLRTFYTAMRDGESTWSDLFEAHTHKAAPSTDAAEKTGTATAAGTEKPPARLTLMRDDMENNEGDRPSEDNGAAASGVAGTSAE